jgi:hypothetical protein
MKKRSDKRRRPGVETAEAPKPTMKIAKARKGLRVKKSRTKATTNVEAALSKEKPSLLFKT